MTAPISLKNQLSGLRPAVLIIFFGSIFINVLALLPSLYLLQVHERVYTSRSLGTLGFLTVIVLILSVIDAVLIWMRREIVSRVAYGFVEKVETPIFRAAQFKSGQVGGSARYVSDLQLIRDTMGGPLIPACCDVVMAPLFIAVLFLIHPVFGITGIALTLILGILSFANGRISDKVGRKSREAQADSLEFSTYLTRNSEVARAMGMLPGLTELWKDRQDQTRRWQAAALRRTVPIQSVLRYIRSLQIVVVTGLGAVLYIAGSITAGMSFAALLIMRRAVGPIEAVVNGWKNFAASKDAFARLEDLLAEDQTRIDSIPLPRPSGQISVSHLTLKAPTKEIIVRDVSFSVDAGSVLAIIGQSGAGKSSLLRAMAGVWQPSGGTLALDGHVYNNWNQDDLGRHIGYLPQENEFIPGTLAQNVARFYPEVYKDDPALFEAIALAGIDDLVKELPDGLNTPLGPKGHPLSGGQKQRIAFARAIYGNPSLILLDEPYSALDSRSEAHLVETLRVLAERGATVVIVTHKLNMLQHCDTVLVMQAGYVQAFGSREIIMQRLPQNKPVTALQVVSG